MSRSNCICNTSTGTICAIHARLLDDIELPRGPQPPTEEAIIEARTTAGFKLRRAMSGSYSNPKLIDEALEAVAEFVRMRNG